MKVRVVAVCRQPIAEGRKARYMREGVEVDWSCKGDLPWCFEPVEDADRRRITKARSQKAHAELDAARKEKKEVAAGDADGAQKAKARLARAEVIVQKADSREATMEAELSVGVAVAVEGSHVDAAPPSLQALPRSHQIVAALNEMDHKDDEQWTFQGLPKVEVVSRLLDGLGYDSEVNRGEINVAQPGFARE